MERNYEKYKVQYYTCKRLRLLKFLRDKGLEPYLTVPDTKNPKYYQWRFKKCAELDAALDEYFSQFNK